MTKEKLSNSLDSAKTALDIQHIIESMREDIIKDVKSQMRFTEQWIEHDTTLTEQQKKDFKRLLNIEAIKLDVQI